MIKRFALLSGLLGILAVTFYFNSSIRQSKAQQPQFWCPSNIQSTQARVQNNIQTPWSKNITVGCEREFNVGSFHNNTGTFASDTILQVVGNNFNATYSNGARVSVPADGNYTLYVNTANQYDPIKCSDQATVTVACSRPPTASCQHGSTQARVQLNDQSPWLPSITNLACGQIFEVGSFHNGNGNLFATDTRLQVEGPMGLNQEFKNDDKIRALFPGRYTLKVTTPNQSGPACEQSAMVDVSCPTWWRVN